MVSLVSYIIRIYRRDESDPYGMVGIVEDIETDRTQRFTSFEELKTILGAPGRITPPEKKDNPVRKHGK